MGLETYIMGRLSSVGWKIHIFKTENDPHLNVVDQWLTLNNIPHKVGSNGGQSGKGMTIYVGSRDNLEIVAAELHKHFGTIIPAPSSDALNENIVIGNIAARFDVQDIPDSPWYRDYSQHGICAIKPNETLLFHRPGGAHRFLRSRPSRWNSDDGDFFSDSHLAYLASFEEYYAGSKVLTGQVNPWWPDSWGNKDDALRCISEAANLCRVIGNDTVPIRQIPAFRNLHAQMLAMRRT